MESISTETEWVRKEVVCVRHDISMKTLEAYRAAGFWPDGRPFVSRKKGVQIEIEVPKEKNWEEILKQEKEKYSHLQEEFQKASAIALTVEEMKKKIDEANAEMDRKVADYERKLLMESRERENIQGKLTVYGNAVEELKKLKRLSLFDRVAWAVTGKLPKKADKREKEEE